MKFRVILAIMLIGSLLGGCARSGVEANGYQASAQPYLLDSGDQLRIVVFGQDDLSNTYAVDSGGKLAMPLIGAVDARGQTIRQLESNIEGRLRNGYLRSPDVTVEIAAYRPFFIMGEVKTPGQYPYVNAMTVQTAVAIAGGFTERANKRQVEITRQAGDKLVLGEAGMAGGVRPGDTIYVKERLF